MAQQQEAGASNRQALASVLSYLRDKQLKETEQVLKRELGLEGASQMDTSPHLPPVPQSDTEPAKYQESYSRPAHTSSPPTEADLQPATQQPSPSIPLVTSPGEPPSSNEEDDISEEEEEDEDISDPAYPRRETHRPMSWPGSLPRHHLLKFPRPDQVISNRALLGAHSSSVSTVISTSTPMAVCSPPPHPPSLSTTPTVPLWTIGSSTAIKPMSLHPAPSLAFSSSSLSSSVTAAAGVNPSLSVIYNMLSSQGLSPQPLLTPLLTIVPSTALVSAAAAGKPVKASPPPLLLAPHGRPSSLLPLTRPITTASILPPRNRNSGSSPGDVPQAEPATGQTIISPVNNPPRVLSQVPAQRTLASIPPSEMTPQYVELKTFAEEFKTKRIRLGYTQGSVGQSLARRGYSNFAQSTISRFEQMQLSATNAAAIKQVLEKWLQETEFPESVAPASSDAPVVASRKRKKRAVFTPQTKSTLDEFFHQNPRPNRQAIESIAAQLDLLPEEVRVWFCNKRQKQKQSSTSSTSSCYSPASSYSPGGGGAGGGFLAIRSPSLSPKRRSPSPKTSFTIEELSKSSNNGGSSTPSPILLTSPFSISPTALSISATGGVFPLMMPTATLPNMTVTQTQA